MKKIILLFLLLCSGLLNAQISLSEIQDTVGKGYVPITDYDPALATYIQKYMLLQDYLRDSIDWGIGTLDLNQVLTNGNDAGGLDAINFAEVEADEFIGDLRGAVLFKAQAGETLAKGDVVYVSGISGNTTIVSKADADDATKMPAFGVVAAAASSPNPVDIYTFGTLSNLNTSAYTIGDILYVSTTAGQLTATPPTGESALLQNIAKVTRVDNSAGSIKISGAGRTNATPNLNTGRLFVGNASNQAVADGTMYVDIANSRVGIGTNSPLDKLHVNGAIRVENSSPLLRRYLSGWVEPLHDVVYSGFDATTYNDYVYLKAPSSAGAKHGITIIGDDAFSIGYTSIETGTITSLDGYYIHGNATGIGIGTNSVSAKLDVNGDVEIATVPTENTDNILTYGSTGLISQRTLADITAEIVADPSLDLEQVLTNGNDAGGQAALNFSTISIGTTIETGFSLYLRETNPNIGFYDTDITSPTNSISGNAGHLAYSVDPTSIGSYFHLWYGNGSEIMRLTDTGNLGIGLTNPDRMLEITNTGGAYEAALEINSNGDLANWARLDLTNVNASTGGFIFYQDNDGKAGIRNLSTDRITYVVDNSSSFHAWEIGSGTERMRLNSTGLGIGTNSPSAKLDVVTTGSTTGLEVNGSTLSGNIAAHIKAGDGGATQGLVIDGDGESTDILLRIRSNGTATPTNPDTKFIVMGDGKTGIGTSVLSAKLHVETLTSSGALINFDGTSNTEYGLRIESNANGGNFETDFTNGTTALLDLYANSSVVSGGDLFVARTQNATPLFLIKGTGKIGIKTSSPAKQLEIENTGADATMLIQTTDDYNAYIEYQNNSGGGGLNYRTGVTTSEHWDISSSAQTMLRIDRAALQNTSFVDFNVTDGSTSMQLNEDGLLTSDGTLKFVNAFGGYTTTYTTGATAAAFSGQTTIAGYDYFLLSGGTLEAAKDQDYFEIKYQDHDGATHSSFTWDAEWRFYEDGYFHTDAGIVHLNDEDTFFKFTTNKIQTYAGSSASPKATYNVSGVTFNEGGVSSNDFRVNGTVSYMLFGDASANRVGIFTSSPQSEFHVTGSVTITDSDLIKRYVSGWGVGQQTHDILFNSYSATFGGGGDYVYVKVAGNSTGGHGMALIGDNAFAIGQSNAETGSVNGLDAYFIYGNSTGIGLGTQSPSAKLDVVGDTELNGEVTWSERALGRIHKTGATTVTTTAAEIQGYDTGAGIGLEIGDVTLDETNGRITVTNTGYYRIDINATMVGLSSTTTGELRLRVNGLTIAEWKADELFFDNGLDALTLSASFVLELSASDYVSLWGDRFLGSGDMDVSYVSLGIERLIGY